MQALKTCSLILITIMLIITAWFYLAAMAVERTVLSSAYYRGLCRLAGVGAYAQAVLEEGLDNRLPRNMPEEMREIVVLALGQAFPGDWLEEQLLMDKDAPFPDAHHLPDGINAPAR